MPWAAIMATAKAFAATAAGKAVISGATSAAATRLLRPKISKPRIDFKQMRDDAQAAGFNPLTAIRSGAISGYMIPALSKQSFVGQFLSGAIRSGTDAFLNKDIDAYNAEMRQLRKQELIGNIGYTGLLSTQLQKQIASIGQQSFMPEFGGSDVKVTQEPLVPGVGKTLTEIMAKTSIENTAKDTKSGLNVNNRITAGLFPLTKPNSNSVIYVPWNPEDADLGAIVGGTIQYGLLSAYEFGERVGNKIDEFRYRRAMTRAVKNQ